MNNSINKVMVTGSSGFVGRHLVQKLRDLDVEVLEIDLDKGFDLSDPDVFTDLEAVDAVVHLAALTFVPNSFEDPARIYRSNTLCTINALDYCRIKGVNRFVYASSYVYGPPQRLPVDESHETNIQNPYGRSKLIGEKLCDGYFHDYGILSVILRPFNIYGPGQADHWLIPHIIKQALTKDEIVVRDLLPKRDYIHVEDVVNAYVKALFKGALTDVEALNVGFGQSYSVKEVIDMVQDILEIDKRIVSEEIQRQNEVMDCYAEVSKIKEVLGWEPQLSFEEGLRQTIESYKAHQ